MCTFLLQNVALWDVGLRDWCIVGCGAQEIYFVRRRCRSYVSFGRVHLHDIGKKKLFTSVVDPGLIESFIKLFGLLEPEIMQ